MMVTGDAWLASLTANFAQCVHLLSYITAYYYILRSGIQELRTLDKNIITHPKACYFDKKLVNMSVRSTQFLVQKKAMKAITIQRSTVSIITLPYSKL